MTPARRATGPATLPVALVLVLVSVLGLAACGGEGDGDKVATGATGAALGTTTSTSTTVTTSTTTPETTDAPTTMPPATTATPPVAGPSVTVLDARPGAGSGEIELSWDGVAGAVGYRVERADEPGGPFEQAASIDVVTGATTTAEGVVFVSAPRYDQTDFVYVEFGEARRRYLRVVAVHAAGDAEPSAVVCGAPPGLPDC